MVNPKLLASSTADLWETFDNREFGRFRSIATQMFRELGYKNSSKKISFYLMKACIYYAEMEDKFESKDILDKYKIIKKYKRRIIIALNGAFKSANFKNSELTATYRTGWWLNFFKEHINGNKIYYIPSLWYLFLEHYNRSNRLLPSIKSVLTLYMATTKGHNKRNRKELIKRLTEYWKIELNYNKELFVIE